jgi:hypothetical protein
MCALLSALPKQCIAFYASEAKLERDAGNDPAIQVWKTHVYPSTPITQKPVKTTFFCRPSFVAISAKNDAFFYFS